MAGKSVLTPKKQWPQGRIPSHSLLDVRTPNRWRNSMNAFHRNPMAEAPPISPRPRKVIDAIGLSLIHHSPFWHTPPLLQSWIVVKGGVK